MTIGAVSCTNNFIGGNCVGSVTYTSSCTILKDLNVSNDIIINTGVTVTSQSYVFIAGNMFDNAGTVSSGNAGNGGAAGTSGAKGGTGGSATSSYGGSGGGNGASYFHSGSTYCVDSSGCDDDGVYGGNTLAIAGVGDTTSTGSCVAGTAGATPSAPTMSNANIQTWYGAGNGAIQTYLEAGGGGGGSSGASGAGNPCVYTYYSGGAGGAGSYGAYIQANALIAGTIIASGSGGAAGGTYAGGGGGGGGGVVMLVYNSLYTAGTYTLTAGGGAAGGTNAGAGGNGGAGQLVTWRYITPPLKTTTPGSATVTTTSTIPASLESHVVSYNSLGSPVNALFSTAASNEIITLLVAGDCSGSCSPTISDTAGLTWTLQYSLPVTTECGGWYIYSNTPHAPVTNDRVTASDSSAVIMGEFITAIRDVNYFAEPVTNAITTGTSVSNSFVTTAPNQYVQAFANTCHAGTITWGGVTQLDLPSGSVVYADANTIPAASGTGTASVTWGADIQIGVFTLGYASTTSTTSTTSTSTSICGGPICGGHCCPSGSSCCGSSCC